MDSFLLLLSRLNTLARKLYHMQPLRLPVLGIQARKLDKWLRKKYVGKEVVTTRMGSKFKLNLSQLIDSSIYLTGSFEPVTTKRIQQLARPGDVALDIGANIGWHTLLMASRVGDAGHVFAIEPTGYAFERLRENVSLNTYGNVTLERIALSDEVQEEAMYSFRSQWNALGGKTDKESGNVSYSTIDEYVQRNGMRRLDLIKLDVDGYECKIIRGGMNTIRRYLPAIVIELGDTWLRAAGDSIEQLYSLLESDYVFCREDDWVIMSDVVGYVKSLPGEKTINAICVPRARISQFPQICGQHVQAA